MNLIKKINVKNAPEAIGPYSQGTILEPFIFISGQIPIDSKSAIISEKDIIGQTKQVIENIDAILKGIGLTSKNVIKTNCYLSNMENFDKFNGEYAKYFQTKPARSCVCVKALPKGALIEIEVTAVKDIN